MKMRWRRAPVGRKEDAHRDYEDDCDNGASATQMLVVVQSDACGDDELTGMLKMLTLMMVMITTTLKPNKKSEKKAIDPSLPKAQKPPPPQHFAAVGAQTWLADATVHGSVNVRQVQGHFLKFKRF